MLKFLAFRLLLSFVLYTLIAAQPGIHQWEPQVAILCDDTKDYYPQFASDTGDWVTFSQATPNQYCSEKRDIFELCKKAYSNLDIVNIVESAHFHKIGNWCSDEDKGAKRCNSTNRWIKPFRCLEAPFQSDALLVPEGCLFDHIHNSTKCWPFSRWNHTSSLACTERNMQIRSFAMLLPCGISLFSGVEFVCCPKKTDPSSVAAPSIILRESSAKTKRIDLEQDKSTDRSVEEIILDEGSTLNPSTLNEYILEKQQSFGDISGKLVTDPYFGSFDPKLEHQNYKEAQQRLEESHREKVTKVMKDWSDLEEKYQDMRSVNPDNAQEFKQKMTERFQISVQSLEEEESAVKHKLSAMHQQRVLERINQRKKEAMKCYTHALAQTNPEVSVVEKCLQKLLRALHKDRSHALAHYRHVLISQKRNLDGTAAEKAITLSRLVDIDKAVSQTMTMLKRFPELSKKLSRLMQDYVQALRSKDKLPDGLLNFSKENEEKLLDQYKEEVLATVAKKRRQVTTTTGVPNVSSEESATNVASGETGTLKAVVIEKLSANSDEGSIEQVNPVSQIAVLQKAISEIDAVQTVVASLTQSAPNVKQQHIMKSSISHTESQFKVREHSQPMSMMWVLGCSMVIMGSILIFARLKCASVTSSRVEQHKGTANFSNQEEKHLAQMQINGYENPTYKYFEVK